jgi:hypothetical protein
LWLQATFPEYGPVLGNIREATLTEVGGFDGVARAAVKTLSQYEVPTRLAVEGQGVSRDCFVIPDPLGALTVDAQVYGIAVESKFRFTTRKKHAVNLVGPPVRRTRQGANDTGMYTIDFLPGLMWRLAEYLPGLAQLDTQWRGRGAPSAEVARLLAYWNGT